MGAHVTADEEKASVSQAETLFPALPDDVVKSAIDLLKSACDAAISISAAESCTGGLLASLLTDIEGMSKVFDRGFVVYSEDAKCDLLGVSREMIETYGAVSEPVAGAMAEGALRQSKAQLAVAITGFAGAAGLDEEAGLVHFSCAAPGMPTRHCVNHFGNIGRGATRIEAIRVALSMLNAMLQDLPTSATFSEAAIQHKD